MADYLDAIKSYAGDYTPPTTGYTNLYSPFQTTNPGVPGVGQPYYDPFKIQGAGSLISPHLEAQICEEGYVLDSETNTCVPEEVAVEAIKKGDKDPKNIIIPNGEGGFVSIRDMFDGGGPGYSGLTFKGPFAGMLNALGIKPRGYKEAMASLDKIAKGSNAAGVAGINQLVDVKNIEALSKAAEDQYQQNVDQGKIKWGNDDDGPSHQEILEAHGHTWSSGDHYGGSAEEESALIDSDLSDDDFWDAWEGSYQNRGGLVHYRQDGGVLPGAKPTIPDQAVAQEQAMAAQGGMAQPPMAPAMAGGMPPQPPMPPMAPPRLSFAEKVAQAREAIRGGQTAVPTTSATPAAPMAMDGQGDGPVEILGGAGELMPSMVGPDMGVDDVDAMLEPESFVMNPEAVEMYGDEIRAMAKGGYV